jgi:hypothetical protein
MGSSRPSTPGLAEKLSAIRTYLSLSQSQMVQRLKDQKLPFPLTVYAGNISRFEQGLREPAPLVLLAYARTAGIAVEVLIDVDLQLPAKFMQRGSIRGTKLARKTSLSGKAMKR